MNISSQQTLNKVSLIYAFLCQLWNIVGQILVEYGPLFPPPTQLKHRKCNIYISGYSMANPIRCSYLQIDPD